MVKKELVEEWIKHFESLKLKDKAAQQYFVDQSVPESEREKQKLRYMFEIANPLREYENYFIKEGISFVKSY